ncbi:SDR family NAD(P)-dependent oxidoreductase [Streptococcus sp. H31]|uniref:SDR family NAD(P)-dependent oxidoreductase n=1 Tax=Streptococcus huangxiaojuni TaxID=3237239 RepID=UPI0034A0F941
MTTVLITGAKSDIGQELISLYLDLKYKLILCDVPEEAKKLKSIYGKFDTVQIYEVNFLDDSSVDNLIKKLEMSCFGIDILVNIAGINILKSFLELDRDTVNNVLKINVTNSIMLTQAVSKMMIANSIEGSIIFIASQHGLVANYDRVPYCISKAVLIQLTKNLALELAAYGIRVNCISPTFILTDKNRHILESTLYKSTMLSEIPLQRYCEAKEIASAIEFLTNLSSKNITGHNLVIDGGWTIK